MCPAPMTLPAMPVGMYAAVGGVGRPTAAAAAERL